MKVLIATEKPFAPVAVKGIKDILDEASVDLELTGAALATAISQSVGFVILLGCFLLKKSSLPMTIRNISRKAGSYGAILKTGFPSFLRQGLASVATVLLNQKAADYGDSAVAAMSIVGKIFMVFFLKENL